MSYRDDDDPFEEDIVFDQAGLLTTTRKTAKSAIRRVSSGKCATFSKTLGLCGAFLGLGLTFAIPGPLSPNPPSELRRDVSLMTYELMYKCQGFMIGAMFGARLLDRFNRLFLVFLALLVTALLVTIIPWCGIVWLLRTDMFLLGVSLGFLTTGGNVLCLDLWGRNSGPFMQALHFSFSLGIFLAPFLSQPLMSPVNYSITASTTTPAMFPLHRFPREVGNMSFTSTAIPGVSSPPVNSTLQPYLRLPFNKSAVMAGNASNFAHLISTLPTQLKEPSQLPQLANNLKPLKTANFSVLNATLASSLIKTSSPTLPANTSSLTSSPSLNASKVSISSEGNPPTVSTSLSSSSAPVAVSSSDTLSGQKSEVSTTTHRAPRPKPVLTNSEKLQDKKWENEKFRKPPPEDLVPVSTTMKPMVRMDNKTMVSGNLSSVPTLTIPSQKSNVTIAPQTSLNPMESRIDLDPLHVNVSNMSTGLLKPSPSTGTASLNPMESKSSGGPPHVNVSNTSTPLLKSSSSSSSSSLATASSKMVPPTVIPLNSTASPLKDGTTPTLRTAPNQSNSTSQNVEGSFATPSSSALPLKDISNVTVPVVTNVLQGQAISYNSSQPGKPAGEHSSGFKPASNEDSAAMSTKTSEPSKDLTHPSVAKTAQKTIEKDMIQITSPLSHVLSDDDGETVSQSTAELIPSSLEDLKSINDTHYIGKSISLDEQEMSAVNFPDTSSVSSSVSKESLSEGVGSASQEPQLQLSSPRTVNVQPSQSPDVLQKPVGKDSLKKVATSKSILQPSIKSSHPDNKETEKLQEDLPVVGANPDLSSIKLTSSSIAMNVSHLPDSISYVPPPVSPKHTHHSKPASTVVNDTTEVTHTVIDAVANQLEKYGLSRMELMYLTVGMVLLGTSFLFLGFLCFNPRDPKSKTDEEEINGPAVRGGIRARASAGHNSVLPSRWLRHTLIGLMLLLLMITSGVQAMYGQLLLVYSIQPPLQISQSTGTALTATFWGALTSTRFACILLASALSPTAMLTLSVAICSCATWLLSAFASSSEVALWIGSVMVSVGTASVFPSGMLWMQRHVLITHRTAAMLIMGPAMGEMFFPTLAYKMMVSMGPASLVHLPALLSLFAIALWAAVWRLARYPRQPLCSHVDESGYQLANQHDEDDLLDLTMSPIVNGSGPVSRNSLRSNGSGHVVHRMNA